jgi:hypothetical protein
LVMRGIVHSFGPRFAYARLGRIDHEVEARRRRPLCSLTGRVDAEREPKRPSSVARPLSAINANGIEDDFCLARGAGHGRPRSSPLPTNSATQLDTARELSTSIVQTHYLMSRQLREPHSEGCSSASSPGRRCCSPAPGRRRTPTRWRSLMRRSARLPLRAPFISFSNSASPMLGCSGSRPRGLTRVRTQLGPPDRGGSEEDAR